MNLKQIKVIYFFILLIMPLFIIKLYAGKHEFNNIIVFGDSLSDVGNIRREDNNILKFVYKPNDNKVYIEYLSKIFTGKDIKPNILGGTNFAVANSTTNYDENCLICISSKYIENNHNINNNDLYIVWSGANDFNNYIFNFSINLLGFNLFSFYSPNSYDSSKNIKIVVNNLISINAKYVIVPNMFEVNITPLFNFLPYYICDQLAVAFAGNSIVSFILPFGLSIFPVFPVVLFNKYAKKIFIENIFRNKIDAVPQNMQGYEYAKQIMGNYYKKIFLGHKIYNTMFNAFKSFTQEFNESLESNLNSINGNIVYIDINKLFNEIIDNPAYYGIDYIILPQCDIRATLYGSDSCYYGDKNNDEGNYLWSDQAHPSPFIHMIYAQYMESVFNAPVLVSSIIRQLDSFNKNNNDYIFNQAINLNHSYINKFLPFISINGNISKIGNPYDYNSKITHTNSLNIGVSYGINTNLLIIAMLNASFGNYHPYDNFNYGYNSQLINLFAKYNINNKFWLGGNFNLGRISANHIKRTIQLGKGIHIEESDTSGKSVGFAITTAYDFEYKDYIILTPYIRLNLNNYRINDFYDRGDRSTSMRYGKSNTTNKDINLSVRIANKNNKKLNSFIELGLNQELCNNPVKIKSGLKSTKISFVREMYSNKKPSLHLALGFNKKFKSNLIFNTNLNYKINTNKDQQLYYSLGLGVKF